jgi:predicted DNA-binding transcriptional regulator AlpA
MDGTDATTHLIRMPEVRRRLGFSQSRTVLAAAAKFRIPICRLNSRTFALRQSDLEKLIARSAGEIA